MRKLSICTMFTTKYTMIIYISIILFIICDVTESLGLEEVYNHLGSRTPYRFRFNKNNTKIKYSNCREFKLWMLVRHGTRLPSPNDIVGMNTTLKQLKFEILLRHQLGQGELNREQIANFHEWSSDVDIERTKYLTIEGEQEMKLLAQRMQKRFQGLVKSKYSNDTYLFKHTATQRAEASARFFVKGLFAKMDAHNDIITPATQIDRILRFYKHCDKWQTQVKKNPATYKEQRVFAVSKDMNNTLASVSKRLGFNKIISLDNLNLMYKICGFETAWDKHYKSPWCYAFDKKDAQVMEYYHDLKHYWLDGYGFDLTYRQACMPIKNMFDSFRTKSGPSATFLFAHSGTLLKILTHIGLYKPESSLTGAALIEDRPWRSSVIDCFAANIAFVLFKCKDGDHVLTLHQERIIKLPMCEKELCPLKYLVQYFHDSIYNCNYTDMCSLNTQKKVNEEL